MSLAMQAEPPKARPLIAYLTGALVMFGGALWASFLSNSYIAVILVMSVPSLFLGYYFASVFNKYILGLLLGVCGYMILEFFMYGEIAPGKPIYEITGPIYAAAYVFAVASVLLARFIYTRRAIRR